MLTPINANVAPSGGFLWTDDLGFHVKGFNLPVVLEQIKARLIARGMFVGEGWQDEVIDQICRQSKVECQEKGAIERLVTWRDFEQFGRVFERYLASDGAFVDAGEAERRAAICATCPKNKPLTGLCNWCAGLMTWSVKLGARLSTTKDEVLFQCEVCACANRLSVHVPLEVMLDERFEASNYPQHCWKKPN